MRRKTPGSPPPSTRLRPSGDGLASDTRSLPLMAKLVIPLALASVLYTAHFVAKRGGGDTAAVEVRQSGDGRGNGGSGGPGAKPPNSFRQLNMIGYEERADGEGQEWMKCREYEETKLGPDKKVRAL